MKLRYKKTGEIWDNAKIATYPCGDKDAISVCQNAFAGQGRTYDTLAELNEDWEDYRPAEPLIKDEKIRKAVRAWAEANGIDESRYRSVKFDHSEHRLKWIRTIIEFDSIEGLENLDDGREYTISELCGEEDE